MGLKLFSTSSYDRIYPDTSKNTSNPNPSNYKIIRAIEKNSHLLVEIEYPDCRNYEGRKILVFDNLTYDQLKSFKTIDPHFSNNKKFKSPIARFEPTERGLKLAQQLIDLI